MAVGCGCNMKPVGRAKKRSVGAAKSMSGTTAFVITGLSVVGVGAALWFFLRRAKGYRVSAIGANEDTGLFVFDQADAEDSVGVGLAVKDFVERYREGMFRLVVTFEDHVVSAYTVSAGSMTGVDAAAMEAQLRDAGTVWSKVA